MLTSILNINVQAQTPSDNKCTHVHNDVQKYSVSIGYTSPPVLLHNNDTQEYPTTYEECPHLYIIGYK